MEVVFFFFSSRRRHTRSTRDWSSDVCSSDLGDLEHYGTVPPENQRNCRMTSVTKHARGMIAEMECTGEMTGKATVEAAWLDDGRSKGKVHFLGSMQAGADSLPVEWTTEYISSYKGPDCGSVKPAATHSH